jgi:hypothetical protein
VLIRLLVLFMALPVQATVFQKQPVEQQIKESDGIVIGHYLRKKSIKLDDGTLATQMIIKMNKEVGMQSDLFGMDEIIVHYPGGKIGDRHVQVEGVPEFVPGENVVLMIKSYQDRYWGMNLGFGTFKLINYGHDKLIVNSIFPGDRNVGQMKLEEFETKVKLIKGSGLRVVMATSYPSESDDAPERAPASVREGKNRAIASNSEQEENREGQSMNTMWLVLILAGMGGLFRLIRQKEVK